MVQTYLHKDILLKDIVGYDRLKLC